MPATYTITTHAAPLPAALTEQLHGFLGHKGEPWLRDIRRRYQGTGPDLCAVAWAGAAPAAHVWVGLDAASPMLGLLGHVYTHPDHRRQGLARRLAEALLAESATHGGRYLILGVDNPAAAALYQSLGFQTLNGPSASGHCCMLHGATPEAFRREIYPAARRQPPRWVPLSPATYAAGILLFNLTSGSAKFPPLGVDDGQRAELDLLEAMAAMAAGGPTVELEYRGGLPAALRVRTATGQEQTYRPEG